MSITCDRREFLRIPVAAAAVFLTGCSQNWIDSPGMKEKAKRKQDVDDLRGIQKLFRDVFNTSHDLTLWRDLEAGILQKDDEAKVFHESSNNIMPNIVELKKEISSERIKYSLLLYRVGQYFLHEARVDNANIQTEKDLKNFTIRSITTSGQEVRMTIFTNPSSVIFTLGGDGMFTTGRGGIMNLKKALDGVYRIPPEWEAEKNGLMTATREEGLYIWNYKQWNNGIGQVMVSPK